MFSVRSSVAVAAVAALGVSPAAAANGSSVSAPATRWSITDLGFVGNAAAINERGQIVGTNGVTRHAFLWQNGRLTDLGTLGGRDSGASGINGRGEVIGTSLTARPARTHGFLWQSGTMKDLGTLGGRTSRPRAINGRGEVVGESLTAGGSVHAFLWRSGRMTDLGTLGGATSGALAIDDRGRIVGSSSTTSGATHAFLWANGKMTDLGTLGARYVASTAVAITPTTGAVVGTSFTAKVTQTGQQGHAFVWRRGRMADLGTLGPSFPSSEAVTANASGMVVGSSRRASGLPRPVAWRGGRIRALSTLGTGPTAVVAVNARGWIAGMSVPARAASYHAVVWRAGAITDLGTLGGAESDAAAIDDHGRIVGVAATRSGAPHAVLWTLAGNG